ncbi:metal ABC transporter permease [candidate division WOR-3 bacterium]|nr:metal ABC transporter permease [candidate division WOR-3 bacterium]
MPEILNYPFFKISLLTAVLSGILFGVISFFIYSKKLSFLGVGISHAAFGGVAVGIFFGIDPFISALVFCLLTAVIIGKISKSAKISVNTSVGIFFSLSMAIGAVFVSLKKGYSFDLSGYLFGNILSVSWKDAFSFALADLIIVPFSILFLKKIIYLSFDEESARISGVKTELLNYSLLVALAFVIVLSIKIIGIILVSALVILPGSFAVLVSRNYKPVIFISVLFSVITMTGGLFLSYYTDTPSGATITILASSLYFLSIIISKLREKY